MKIENMKKILIATDGSDYSMRAAELGISIAKLLNTELYVIYVINIVTLDVFGMTNRQSIENDLRKDGERATRYVVSMAAKEGVKADAILAVGQPYEQIVQFAKANRIDMIVMGTYGRRGAERILIGSVAERVIEYSLCPVLVVH